MTVEDLKRRYEYGYWANKKFFAVLTNLTAEEFTRVVAGGYGSIRTPVFFLAAVILVPDFVPKVLKVLNLSGSHRPDNRKPGPRNKDGDP